MNGTRDRSSLGQNGPKDAPDPEALAAVRAAQMAPEDAEVVEAGAKPSAEAKGAAVSPKDVMAAMMADPGMAAQMRAFLGIQASGAVAPQTPRRGWRDYDAPELRVMGGVEVRHPEYENGSQDPLPPGFIKRYLRADGTETDYDAPHIEKRKRNMPIIGENGKPAVTADGSPLYDEVFVDVVIDKGAAKGPDGRPVKTARYQQWLDVRRTGNRLDSNVRSDIAAGVGIDGRPVVAYGVDGAPTVAGPASMVLSESE